MLKIGITGGIGSGKSIFCDLLKAMGYPVYNSDLEAKNLCNESEALKSSLKEAFGKNLYDDGVLNKAVFSSIIFNDNKKLEQANNIIHPAVISDFLHWAKIQNSSIVFIESAILFESKLQNFIDKSIAISAPEEIRMQRVMDRDSVSKEVVLMRIKNQLSEAERLQKADYIIYNDDKQLLIPQLEKVLSLLQ